MTAVTYADGQLKYGERKLLVFEFQPSGKQFAASSPKKSPVAGSAVVVRHEPGGVKVEVTAGLVTDMMIWVSIHRKSN